MKQHLKTIAIPGLRWTLGLVVLLESCQFAFSASAIRHAARIVIPPWLRLGVAGTEVIAALLFLVPAVSDVGGYLLLPIFAIAAALHVLHGEFDVGALAVYGMGV